MSHIALQRNVEAAVDISTAHVTLGVGPETPLPEVKSRFRLRAQMLHPDRLGDRPELVAEAERSMAELNEAWRTICLADRDGTRTATNFQEPDVQLQSRMPLEGECDLCGSRPAGRLRLRTLVGRVVFWRTRSLEPDLCANCATSVFREAQSATLVTGWWGLFAVYANVVAVVLNIAAILRHRRRIPPPQSRDPSVSTPVPPGLPLARPIFRRPGPLIASSAAAAVMALFVLPSLGSTDDRPSRVPTDREVDRAVGSCLDANGREVDCGDEAAAYEINARVASAAECGAIEAVFTSAADDQIYCAVVLP